MASTPDLVCVGHIISEMIHFQHAIEGPFLGSPPAYCATAAARQGMSTGLVTRIGPDMPRRLLQPMEDAGVDLAGIRTGGLTTTTELIYDARGHKEIRYPTKAPPITEEDIPASYRGCRLIYLCPMDHDVLLENLTTVVAAGQTSAVDLGGYGGVHMSLATRRTIPSLVNLACGVAEHFHIVKASDEDAAVIFDRDDPHDAAKRLLACGPDVVIITMGPRGALVATAGDCRHVPPLPGTVKDTTGGGDTFMGGFLSHYLRHADPLEAARWGCATAIQVIEQSGGVRPERMPDHRQVEARVRGYG